MDSFDKNQKEQDDHSLISRGSSLSVSQKLEESNRPEFIKQRSLEGNWKKFIVFKDQIYWPLSIKCNNNNMSLRVKKTLQRLHRSSK